MSSWFNALSRTRKQVAGTLSRLIGRTVRVDEETLDDLEAMLLRADLPVPLTLDIIDTLRDDGLRKEQSGTALIRQRLLEALGPSEPFTFSSGIKPFTILMLGINGSGKTTTSAKLARMAARQGHRALLGAGDTFRAAGSSQLKIWGDRIGCDVVTGAMGADAAAVAYDTMKAALARKADIVIMDTAGRMHTRTPLMDELDKVCRAIEKNVAGAPHEKWIVLDASMGQNAVSQARSFHERVPLTGVVVSKLDGSSKAGFILSIKQEIGVPIRFVGLGEGEDDLAPFEPEAFVDALLGIGQEEEALRRD